jgi:hypothetical protein
VINSLENDVKWKLRGRGINDNGSVASNPSLSSSSSSSFF